MANENQPSIGTPPPMPEAALGAPPQSGVPAPPAETAIMLPRGPDAATDAAQSVPMTPPSTEDASGTGLEFVDWILLGLVVVLSFLVSSVPAFNSDVWMQLATGRQIAHGDYLPGGADPFSCATEAGEGHDAVAWINHSWLYALGLYLLYSASGGAGVIVVKAAMIAAMTIALMQIRSRATPRLLVAILLALTVLSLSPRLFLQPMLMSYVLLCITLLVLHRAGVFDGGAAPSEEKTVPHGDRWLWALPVLFVLWVNLDNWFVLGPIVVALSWAGLALQRRRRRGEEGRVAVRRLGVVFGVCLLACLINPFHVRAFQLPPELAYQLVRAGDWLGVPLPNALFGGGRTLAILQQTEPQQQRALSPLVSGYWSNPGLGYTIAGACFFPLLILSLLSFALNGFYGDKPGGAALQPARFLVWLFFAVLAILSYRLIPFFAIVAGPIAALNLGEFLAWYTRPAGDGPAPVPWVGPLLLARVLGVLLLLGLLLFAWPGWLIGPPGIKNIGTRLHVDWDVPIDASLRLAAERLGEIQATKPPANGQVRVFSTGMDLSCYCAWFAPGVKGFLDARYNLFPHAAADYARAKQAFFDKSNRDPNDVAREWTAVLNAHRIDHVAVENFLNTPQVVSWWGAPSLWLQQFADKNVAVFAWSGGRPPWRGDAVLDAWNTLAFGRVPASERPPARGVPEAPENRTLLDRYLEAPPASPEALQDIDLKLFYGQFINKRVPELARLTQPTSSAVQLMPMYSLASVPLSPGAIASPVAMTSALALLTAPDLRSMPFWAAIDSMPPAVPILLTRRAWRAVAETPENERCYIYLSEVYTHMHRQEGYWINPVGRPPVTTLSVLRQVQVVSALRSAVDIGFNNPGQQYYMHRKLAEHHYNRHQLDLAAEHFGLAEEALEVAAPDEPRLHEEWRKDKKQLGELRKFLDGEIGQRKREFAARTAARKPMEKVAELVLNPTYRHITKDNKEEIDPEGWGLTGMALQLLKDVDPQALPDQREQLLWGQLTLDLLYKTGHAREAAEVLKEFQRPLGQRALQFRLFRAAVRGNYEDQFEVLKEWDLVVADQVRKSFQLALSTGLMAPPAGALGQSHFMMGMALPGSNFNWTDALGTWTVRYREYFDAMTLHGIIALEAGDTAEAQRLFETVLREAHGVPFVNRPVAERYATLLASYQKR